MRPIEAVVRLSTAMFGDSMTRARVAKECRYQNDSQREDLLNQNLTKTELIALLDYMQKKSWRLELTAVRTDHSSDFGLGTPQDYHGCHSAGWAVDCWPLNSDRAGDYMDANSHSFRQFLKDASAAPFLMQIGLAGEADAPENHAAAGPTSFSDDGGDHVHLGTKA